MSALPKGWTLTTVGEVTTPVATCDPKADPQATFTYVDIGSIDNKAHMIVRPKVLLGSDAPSRARQLLRPGDTVFSTVRTYLRNIGFVDNSLSDAIGSTGFSVLRPAPGIQPRFLYYHSLTPAFVDGLSAQMRGTSYPAVVDSQVRAMTIPIPSTAEQERIVATIEEHFSRLDAGVAALREVRQNLKHMRAAILDAAVTGRLVSSDPSDEPGSQLMSRLAVQRQHFLAHNPYAGSRREPILPNATGLPHLPPTWCWATVDQLCTRVVDGVHKKPNYVSAGIPFVTVRNLTAGPGISFDRLNYVTAEDHAEFIKRTRPERGDLLLSKDGTLGVVRAVRDDRQFSIFVSVALMKPVDNALTDYLELALSAPVVQRQMVPKGSGLQHIHLEDLRQDCVPVPPLNEQRRIADEARRQISLVDAMEAQFDGWDARTAALRASILSTAFSGKLVPQDPADEPASVLIERIAAEWQSSNGHTAKRRRKLPTPVTP